MVADDMRLRNLIQAHIRLVDAMHALRIAGANMLADKLDREVKNVKSMVEMRKKELGL